jgi:hypothetical protein
MEPIHFDDLSDFQSEFFQRHSSSQVFSVVSWGCAATAWLAKVLNSHPDIYCVHAANTCWQTLGNIERLDGTAYLRIVASMGSNHVASGDVHGVSRHLIAGLRQSLGRRFNAAVVVREPISRLRSQLGLFAMYQKFQLWRIDYLEEVISAARITLPDDTYACRLFVHGVNMLNAIVDEQEVGRVYRAEDLTRRTDILGDFVEEITLGSVAPTAAWLRSSIDIPPVNRHARPVREPFRDWQIDVIHKVVNPRSWEKYAELGYPFWETSLTAAVAPSGCVATAGTSSLVEANLAGSTLTELYSGTYLPETPPAGGRVAEKGARLDC